MNPVEKLITEIIAQHLAAIGEPWISAFEPAALREKVCSLGFREVEIYEPDDLNRRYLYRRKDGLRCGGRILCARV
jgi:hypothetical protein